MGWGHQALHLTPKPLLIWLTVVVLACLDGVGLLYLMSIPCPDCAVSMPEGAELCPSCGRATQPDERADGRVGGISERLAGALAYTLIAAIVFLLVDPYKKNAFVRFHSFQSIGFWLGFIMLIAGLRIAGVLLFFLPLVGHLLIFLLSMVVVLGFVILWVVLLVKALQGEIFLLPLVGEYSESQARK